MSKELMITLGAITAATAILFFKDDIKKALKK